MVSDNPTAPRRKSKKKGKDDGSMSPLLVGGGIVVCLILGAMLMSGGSGSVPDLPPAVQPGAAAAPISIPALPPLTATFPPRTTPATNNKPKPNTTAAAAPAATSSVSWMEPKLAAEPAGEALSLLDKLNPGRDVISGELQKAPSALVVSSQCKLYLPATLPDDYQLKFVVSRIGTAGSLGIGFMMGGQQGVILFDGDGAKFSGLFVDQREPQDNCTTRTGKQLEDKSTIELTVHPSHVYIAVDGKTVVNWIGDPRRLFTHPNHSLPCRECPYLLFGESKYIIESATMTPLQPEPSPKRPARVDSQTDVIPLIDLARDIRRGSWSIDSDTATLRSPGDGGRILLPIVAPLEYTLSFKAELPVGQDAAFALGLVAGDSPVQFVVSSKEAGIDTIDGKRWSAKSLEKLPTPGTAAACECTVTADGIRASIDGTPVADWQGETRRLGPGGDWVMSDARRFFLATSGGVKFSEFKLGPPVTPEAEPQPELVENEPVDLLALIDPERDALSGTWERDSMALKSRGDADDNRLLIPLDFPAEYKLTVKVARAAGGKTTNEALQFGLPFGDSKLRLAIDSQKSTFSGIFLDNTKLNDSPFARKGQVISNSATRELEITVRATGIKVTSDGKKVVDWSGHPHRATEFPDETGSHRRLWFGGRQQAFRFEKIQLEPLESSSFPTAEPTADDGKLLPIMNGARDSRSGEWILDRLRLASPASGPARINLPVTVPDQYQIQAKVERKQGSQEFYLGLIVGGFPCAVLIDAEQMRQAGIDGLDGKVAVDPGNIVSRRYPSPLLPSGQPVQIRCSVLRDTILVSCGDREVIRWHGDPRRLAECRDLVAKSPADREQLWLGSGGTAFNIRDLEFRALTDDEARSLIAEFSGVSPMESQRSVPLGSVRP